MKRKTSVFVLAVFLFSMILGALSMSGVYATPAGTILYQSNFAGASSLAEAGFKYDQGEISDVRFEGGKLVLDNRDNTDTDVFLVFEPSLKLPAGVDQFTISWEYMYLDGTGPSRYLAMNWFYVDTDNYSGTWHRAENNRFTVDVKSGGAFTHHDNLGEFVADDFGVVGGTGVQHYSKIVYDKGVVTAYVDGILIGSGSNASEVFGGEFGIMVKVECAVVLDNFIIYTGTGDPLSAEPVAADPEPDAVSDGNPGVAAEDGKESEADAPPAVVAAPSPRTGDAGTVAFVMIALAGLAAVITVKRKNTVK